MASEQGDLLQIRGLRVQGEIPHLHVFRHTLSKGSHGELLCEVGLLQSSASMLPQRRHRPPIVSLATGKGLKGRPTGYRVAV